ncbi:MAG TPA: CoA ester lyase [Stellaceae bacterium]|nr:CoA ester lyase [Stellaceae bacterium]
MSTAPIRPRRSVLFLPGSNPRAIEKARALPADGLIFDLEDAVAPEVKAEARTGVAAALAAGGYGTREVILRVNPLDTAWGHADLAAAATLPIDAVLLPKVENAERVRLTIGLLDALGAPPELSVWCMIETPLGVLAAAQIAGASPRLGALVLGTSDLSKDLRVRETRDRQPLLTALGLVLLAARAYGRAVLDGVHLDLDDAEGFAAMCRQGRELGFDGKTVIHPAQIEPANAAFSPTSDEVARAQRVIAAYREAIAAGKGAVRLDGRLVEALHVEEAQRTLALAEAIAATARG